MYNVWDFNIVPRMQGSPGGELGFPAKVTPDESIWFIEEMANKIGRVNPKTGEFKEYSVAEDKNASLATTLRDPRIWAPSLFDGDASL